MAAELLPGGRTWSLWALTIGEVPHAHGDFTGCLQDLHSLKAERDAQSPDWAGGQERGMHQLHGATG